MGTNYYLRKVKPRLVYDEYHIAKRSAGGASAFRIPRTTGARKGHLPTTRLRISATSLNRGSMSWRMSTGKGLEPIP